MRGKCFSLRGITRMLPVGTYASCVRKKAVAGHTKRASLPVTMITFLMINAYYRPIRTI